MIHGLVETVEFCCEICKLIDFDFVYWDEESMKYRDEKRFIYRLK